MAFESAPLCDLPQMPLCKSPILRFLAEGIEIVEPADRQAVVTQDVVHGRQMDEEVGQGKGEPINALCGAGCPVSRAGASVFVTASRTILRRLLFCVMDQALGNLCLGLSTGLSTQAVDKCVPRRRRCANSDAGDMAARGCGMDRAGR
jgi:hypothetical protein